MIKGLNDNMEENLEDCGFDDEAVSMKEKNIDALDFY